MNAYLVVKTIHIVSSVLLAGTGLGTAFFLFFANRVGPARDEPASPAAQAVVCRLAVRAELGLIAPAVIVQPLSGFALVALAGFPSSAPWLVLSMLLSLLAGMCWLLAALMHLRMARTAAADLAAGRGLSPQYWADARSWERLAYPGFVALLVIFVLMVDKPALWG